MLKLRIYRTTAVCETIVHREKSLLGELSTAPPSARSRLNSCGPDYEGACGCLRASLWVVVNASCTGYPHQGHQSFLRLAFAQ